MKESRSLFNVIFRSIVPLIFKNKYLEFVCSSEYSIKIPLNTTSISKDPTTVLMSSARLRTYVSAGEKSISNRILFSANWPFLC